METIRQYIEANKDRFIEELFGLLRIPSISAKPEHKADMIKAAEYWKNAILAAGADKAEVMPTEGNPIVYGEKIIDSVLNPLNLSSRTVSSGGVGQMMTKANRSSMPKPSSLW